MAKIKRYGGLRCWQEARSLVNSIYDLLEDAKLNKEFTLSDQLKRAGISVMTDIAEGFNRYHKRDFIRFLDYAQSSAQEVKSLLYIVKDRKFKTEEKIVAMQETCDYCQAMILALLKHVKSSLGSASNNSNEPEVHYLSDQFFE